MRTERMRGHLSSLVIMLEKFVCNGHVHSVDVHTIVPVVKNQDAVGDGRLRPDAGSWRTRLKLTLYMILGH